MLWRIHIGEMRKNVDFLNLKSSEEYRHASGKIHDCNFIVLSFKSQSEAFVLFKDLLFIKCNHLVHIYIKYQGRIQDLAQDNTLERLLTFALR